MRSTPSKILLTLFLLSVCLFVDASSAMSKSAIVVNTWPFTNATNTAWETLMKSNDNQGFAALDAIECGVHQCEREQCDHSVGWGGSPDENGHSSLDALIMCGKTRRVGAVANLKNIKAAIKVARRVMDDTYHSMLVGEDATVFAEQVGFKREDISSDFSRQLYDQWIANNRTPNYWRKSNAYKPVGHDTIGMIVIDDHLNVACGSSTNGLSFRIPGRVGDSPLVGSGAYCENGVGGCSATGNGDVIQRFLPAFYATMLMKLKGLHPREASYEALAEISQYYSVDVDAYAGLVCVNVRGEHGAAAIGQFENSFKYSMRNYHMKEAQVFPWRT